MLQNVDKMTQESAIRNTVPHSALIKPLDLQDNKDKINHFKQDTIKLMSSKIKTSTHSGKNIIFGNKDDMNITKTILPPCPNHPPDLGK